MPKVDSATIVFIWLTCNMKASVIIALYIRKQVTKKSVNIYFILAENLRAPTEIHTTRFCPNYHYIFLHYVGKAKNLMVFTLLQMVTSSTNDCPL